MIQLPAHRYGLIFRLVEENDAAFILGMRTDPKLSRHVSPVENDLDAQKSWICNYKQREARAEEYYFLYTDMQNQPLGVFRLYNIDGATVTSGSWLAERDNNALDSIKADLFLTSIIFEELNFECCMIDVRKENKKLVRYHKMFFTQTGEDEQNIYLEMRREGYMRKHKFLTDIIDPK
ncbi:RimJ/RimL family protein N-acetyltransferase [Mucilaginibacter sp. UYNi724]